MTTGEHVIKVKADTTEALASLLELRRVSIRAGLVSPYYVVVGMVVGLVLGVLIGLGVTV